MGVPGGQRQCVGYERAVSRDMPWAQQELSSHGVAPDGKGPADRRGARLGRPDAKAPEMDRGGAGRHGVHKAAGDTDADAKARSYRDHRRRRSTTGSGFEGSEPQAAEPARKCQPNSLTRGTESHRDVEKGTTKTSATGTRYRFTRRRLRKPSPARRRPVAAQWTEMYVYRRGRVSDLKQGETR